MHNAVAADDGVEGIVGKRQVDGISAYKFGGGDQLARKLNDPGKVEAGGARAAPGGSFGQHARPTTDVEHPRTVANPGGVQCRLRCLPGYRTECVVVALDVGSPAGALKIQIFNRIFRLPDKHERPRHPGNDEHAVFVYRFFVNDSGSPRARDRTPAICTPIFPVAFEVCAASAFTSARPRQSRARPFPASSRCRI